MSYSAPMNEVNVCDVECSDGEEYVAAIGGLGGVALGATISTYVNSITSNIYDDVCDYYKDK